MRHYNPAEHYLVTELIAELLDETVAVGEMWRIIRSIRETLYKNPGSSATLNTVSEILTHYLMTGEESPWTRTWERGANLASANALLKQAPMPNPNGEGPTNAEIDRAFETLRQLRILLTEDEKGSPDKHWERHHSG